jgi:hypothetical protein
MEFPVLAFGVLTAGELESSAAVELIDCRRCIDFDAHNFSIVTLLQQLGEWTAVPAAGDQRGECAISN